MTQTTGPDLNKCSSAAALTQAARQVHHAMLTTFVETGQAPMRRDLERIAAARGADPAAVLAELAEGDLIAFGADGEIRSAYPFSPAPTRIQVTWAGGPAIYAMCAIDALGMSAMLGHPVMITAAEPGTGCIITIDADGDRARWSPQDAVVFADATGEDCCAADRTCGYINFFTSARAARHWAEDNPAITGVVLGQAQALGQGIAEFGHFLRTGDGTSRH